MVYTQHVMDDLDKDVQRVEAPGLSGASASRYAGLWAYMGTPKFQRPIIEHLASDGVLFKTITWED